MEGNFVADDMISTHLIRTSIEIVSIRDQKFMGRVFFRCHAEPDLNTIEFRTMPNLDIPRISRDEINVPPTFHSFEVALSAENLKKVISTLFFTIDMIHVDKNLAEKLKGVARVKISQIESCEVVKTPTSYVRILDGFHRIEDPASHSKLGEIRVKIYMEDLGPSIPQINEDKKEMEEIEKGNPPDELEELQMKVVSELENWKKMQEAKFLLEMKTREAEMIDKMAEGLKKKEIDREKVLRNYEASITSIDMKLRDKVGELQKRENKLILLENELKSKINEVSSEVASKNEEIRKLKADFDEEKKKFKKAKVTFEAKQEALTLQLSKKDSEIERIKAEMDQGIVGQLKSKMMTKDIEIDTLKNECSKLQLAQSEYRDYSSKLQESVMLLKSENDLLKSKLAALSSHEIEFSKAKLQQTQGSENGLTFSNLRKELKTLSQPNQPLGGPEGKKMDPELTLAQKPDEIIALEKEKERLQTMGISPEDILMTEIDAEIKQILSKTMK